MLVGNTVTIDELRLKLESDPIFVKLLAKKFVVLGDSILAMSIELCGDKNSLVEIFSRFPHTETAFYKAVEEQSSLESKHLLDQAIAGALRQLNDVVTERKTAEVRDLISASRAVLAYGARGSGESAPKDPLENLYDDIMGKRGP
jgi:hypothetical protein